MPDRKYTGPPIPDWWMEPEPVDLKVDHVGQVDAFPDEFIVGFKVNGETYTGFFPARYVNRKKKVLSALIVADIERVLLT